MGHEAGDGGWTTEDRGAGVTIGEKVHLATRAWPDADGAVLFAGEAEGRMDLGLHLDQFGPLPQRSAQEVATLIEESGLAGRGGAGFPLAVKLDTARRKGGRPVVIVNLSESEPASRKDATLALLRPHLLLDGASAAARSLGATEVSIRFHAGDVSVRQSLKLALEERADAELDDPIWHLSSGPRRYVAGESSAVASAVAGGLAIPQFRTVPLAVRGPSGRPTIVSNAETMAHVGALMRIGSGGLESTGPASGAGTRLVTLTGGVRAPGTVVEITGEGTFGELLQLHGVHAVPAAVLVGGYAGTWLDGETAWNLTIDEEHLATLGASLGCGLIGVVPVGRCAMVEVAHVATYLAEQSAGQCGPCVGGLPEIARLVTALAEGTARRRHVRQLIRLTAEIEGRGACSHPDAVIAMVRSALSMLSHEVDRHLSGAGCADTAGSRLLPLVTGTRS